MAEVKMGEITRVCGVLTQLRGPWLHKDKSFINLERRAKRNGYSILKQILVDAIKSEARKSVLNIIMPCGSKVAYRTFDDIPEVDRPCTCGDPSHWFIKYEAIDAKVS